MDEADRAQLEIERATEWALRGRRQIRTYALSCGDCGEVLPEHRREFGVCLECAELREWGWRRFRPNL
jgi:RNA polymerase-binding transcription factor DksA